MLHRLFLKKDSRPPIITWVEFCLVIFILSSLFFFNELFKPRQSTASITEVQITSYSIPAEAKYVSGAGSNANDGSIGAPYQTISYAISKVSSGGTIVIRGGTYHEYITLSKPVTIQPYPNEVVWFDGAERVSGWTSSGTNWKAPWTYKFTPLTNGNYIDETNYPAAGYPDMVFINGTPLIQVISSSEVTAGKFWVDTVNNELYIGSDPNGKNVEASSLSQAINIYSTALGTVIRGLGFKRYATNPTGCPANCQTAGAIMVQAPNVTIEKNTFYMNAEVGLKLLSSNLVVRDNRFAYNGASGVSSSQAHNLIFMGNELGFNNYERFDPSWDSAGAKLTNATNMTISMNYFHDNFSSGLWCDINCYQAKIVKNVSKANSRYGLHFEISGYSIIASNLFLENKEVGAVIGSGSNNNEIYNNTVIDNGMGMRIQDDGRTCSSSNISTWGCTADSVSKGLTWDTTNNVVVNNIFSKASTSNPCSNTSINLSCLLSVRDFSSGASRKTAEVMVTSLDYNAYHRVSSNSPANFAQWSGGYNSSTLSEILYYYASVSSFKAYSQNLGKNYEAHGYSFDNQTDPFFVNPTLGDYRIRTNSLLYSAGSVLPSSVASALGLESGVRYSVGAIEWYGMNDVIEPSPSVAISPSISPSPSPTPSPSVSVSPTPVLIPSPTVLPTASPSPTPSPSPSASSIPPGKRRKKITINASKVVADQGNFPALVSITDTDLSAHALSSAADIVFTGSNGSSILSHDIESFNKSTGTLVAWVKVPILSSQSNTDIYLYYANSSAISKENESGVWPNTAKAVMHLAESLSGSSIKMNDSTSNGNEGKVSGIVPSGSVSEAGKLATAIYFDNNNDSINLGSASNLDNIFATGGSISAWVKAASYGENNNGRIVDKSSTPQGGNGWTLALNNNSGICNGKRQSIAFLFGFSKSNAGWCTDENIVSIGSWYHIVLTYNRNSLSNIPKVYVNGVEKPMYTYSAPAGVANSDAQQSMVIGNRQTHNDRTFHGLIDEVRVYSSTLSPAWISTEYNNQSNPGAFYSVSPTEVL